MKATPEMILDSIWRWAMTIAVTGLIMTMATSAMATPAPCHTDADVAGMRGDGGEDSRDKSVDANRDKRGTLAPMEMTMALQHVVDQRVAGPVTKEAERVGFEPTVP